MDIFTTSNSKDLNINNLSQQNKSLHSSQCNINSTIGFGPRIYSTPSPTIINATTNNKNLLKTKTIDMGSINDIFNNIHRTNSIVSSVSDTNKKSLDVPERQCKISFQDNPIDLTNYLKQNKKKETPIRSIIQTPQSFNKSPLTKNSKKYTYKKQKLNSISSSLIADDFNIEINNLNYSNFTTIDQIINFNNHHQNCKKNNEVIHYFLKPRRKQNYGNIKEFDATMFHNSSSETKKKNNKHLRNSTEIEYDSFTDRKASLTFPSPRDSSCEPLIGRKTEKNV